MRGGPDGSPRLRFLRAGGSPAWHRGRGGGSWRARLWRLAKRKQAWRRLAPKGSRRGKARLRKQPHGQRCWFYLFFFFVYIIQCHYRKYGKCQALQGHYVLEAELMRGCQQAFGGIEHPADNQQEHCVYQKLLHRASFFFVILNVFGLQLACRAAAVVAWLVPSSVGIVFAPVPFRAMKQAVFHCHTACFISQYGTFHRQVHRPFNFNICPVRFEDCRFANMHFL